TSHNLGQNFAKAFDLKFQTEAGDTAFAWNTSWGVSTRLIGGLVMTHGDDNGLRVPPLLAPIEVVIVPIWRSDEDKARVLEAANKISATLSGWERRNTGKLRVHLDSREGIKPGAKYYEWELRGIPLRLEFGPRDLDANQCVLVRRDNRVKRTVTLDSIGEDVADLLSIMQTDMKVEAYERREANSIRGKISYGDFKELMAGKGGFVYAGFCGNGKCEQEIKEETKATIRVLPDEEFRSADVPETCLKCGQTSVVEALWARAY
ncbi:MAG: His/Gly/Thr/Pro-type tRNA ligase C-terminal domain-containing protein, partial [Gemmatimonadaceae bacterium]